MDVSRLLHPRSIAVVGASEAEGSYGGQTVLNLDACGYPGEVWPVNPRRQSVHGHRCYPALCSLPEPPDAVVVSVPAEIVPAIVEEAGVRGCGGAVVFGAGFAEVRPGASARSGCARRRSGTTCPCAAPTATGSWRCTSAR